ncbi:ABC transporter permease [Haloprofundus salinisoli]|uniref:ABC transporter permease n=1 Tax=Haloprofundus salinisoli TaxID=2876193 RepID=UPI00295EE866|nr:ABC transporter permease [Haloprofundus salinisoli]
MIETEARPQFALSTYDSNSGMGCYTATRYKTEFGKWLVGMNYYVKRFGQAALTLFAVITITFVLYRMMPGNPIQQMQAQLMSGGNLGFGGSERSPEQVDRLVRIYTGIEPNQPIHIAYFEYLRDIILYQDFGESIWHDQPVFYLLFRAMPWSVFVSVYGLITGISMTIIFGSLMAYYEGSRFDKVMTGIIIVIQSVPYYVGAILMLSFLAFQFGWFPTGGHYDSSLTPGLNIPFMTSVAHHATLPILTGFILGFGGSALGLRGNAIRIIGEDFVRVARLRGISSNRIATYYVGRNAILPLYTGIMMSIASLFGSSIIMETIFTYPGVGWYTYDALMNRDYPLLMGAFIFFTVITVIGILLADLTYGLVDPRASEKGKESY